MVASAYLARTANGSTNRGMTPSTAKNLDGISGDDLLALGGDVLLLSGEGHRTVVLLDKIQQGAPISKKVCVRLPDTVDASTDVTAGTPPTSPTRSTAAPARLSRKRKACSVAPLQRQPAGQDTVAAETGTAKPLSGMITPPTSPEKTELAQSTAGPGFLKADASGGSPSVNPSAARAGKKPVQLPRKITIETTVRGLSRLEKKLGTFLQRSRGGTPPEVVVVVSATPAGEPAHAFTGPIRIPAYGAAVTIMAAAGTQRPVLTFKRKKFDGEPSGKRAKRDVSTFSAIQSAGDDVVLQGLDVDAKGWLRDETSSDFEDWGAVHACGAGGKLALVDLRVTGAPIASIVRVDGHNTCRVEKCKLTGAADPHRKAKPGGWGHGIIFAPESTGAVVDTAVSFVGGSGIVVRREAAASITGCTIHQVGNAGIFLSGAGSSDDGADAVLSVKNNQVSDFASFWDQMHAGIYVEAWAPVHLENNKVINGPGHGIVIGSPRDITQLSSRVCCPTCKLRKADSKPPTHKVVGCTTNGIGGHGLVVFGELGLQLERNGGRFAAGTLPTGLKGKGRAATEQLSTTVSLGQELHLCGGSIHTCRPIAEFRSPTIKSLQQDRHHSVLAARVCVDHPLRLETRELEPPKRKIRGPRRKLPKGSEAARIAAAVADLSRRREFIILEEQHNHRVTTTAVTKGGKFGILPMRKVSAKAK